MALALNNLQRLICHKTQSTNQPTSCGQGLKAKRNKPVRIACIIISSNLYHQYTTTVRAFLFLSFTHPSGVLWPMICDRLTLMIMVNISLIAAHWFSVLTQIYLLLRRTNNCKDTFSCVHFINFISHTDFFGSCRPADGSIRRINSTVSANGFICSTKTQFFSQ